MQLQLEFTCRTSVSGPHVVGRGPHGLRHYYEMMGGEIEGPRLKGRSLGSGADWMLVEPDGLMQMNVRMQILTTDGAVLCIAYRGLAEPSERLHSAMTRGEASTFDSQLIRTCWTLECGHPAYEWVNRFLFVGEGRFCPDDLGKPGFEHRVYRLA